MSSTPEIHQDRRGGNLTFNLAAVIWITSTILSVAGVYWSARMAVKDANDALSVRLQDLENYKTLVIEPTVTKVDAQSSDIAAIRQGLTILLNSQGFNGAQILSAKTITGGSVISR